MTHPGGDASQPPTAEPNSVAEASTAGAEATQQVQLPPAYAEQPSFDRPIYPPPYDPAPAYGGPPRGFAPPQSYGPPAPAYGSGYGPPKQPTNGLAMGSLAASGVGLFLSIVLILFGGFIGSIPALVGIVLGVVALKQLNGSGEGGRNLAIVGIACGAAALVISVGFYVIYFAVVMAGS